MNKKKLIIIIAAAVLVVLGVTATFLTLGLTKYQRFTGKITDSTKDMISSVTEVSVKDKDILVYKYSKTIEVQEESAKITFAESKFNVHHVLEESKTYEKVENFKRDQLLTFNFDRDNLKDWNISKNTLTITVDKDLVKTVFSTSNLEVTEDVTIVFTLNNNHIESINSSLKLTSGKIATLNMSFNY